MKDEQSSFNLETQVTSRDYSISALSVTTPLCAILETLFGNRHGTRITLLTGAVGESLNDRSTTLNAV